MASTVDDDAGDFVSEEYASSFRSATGARSLQERRNKRRQKKAKEDPQAQVQARGLGDVGIADRRATELLSRDEDELLKFVAKINKVYQEKLKKPAPFMTFVFCGMQSAGKSTIMERFMNAVLNIVQEGTGTRCPLDTTCIHDDTLTEPLCELSGEELQTGTQGDSLNVSQVFERITEHNKKLGSEDRFSTKPLYLVYRARNVQNMRFVDTPGIISNKSDGGKDNREDIKSILRSELEKPNTKLCVLLEPKEFSTNPIIDFCDESLGGRKKWIGSATFLMTKFDKQTRDSRSGSKANNFFKEFHENKCFPHLVMTETLIKEDLPSAELYKARQKLLASTDKYESREFQAWRDGHRVFHAEQQDQLLDPRIEEKIGFPTAKKVMREIMLTDTAKRLPEVLSSLRNELDNSRKELKILQEKQKFSDPKELKHVVGEMFIHIERRITAYLKGDLESSLKFPERLQTLEEEIDAEEESDWATKDLNFHTEKEDHWRDRIADMKDYPEEVQAENKFLGGKQYQRAIEFFRAVMVEALPNPYQLEDKIANVTGYLSDGLHRENWEHAMVEITRVCMKDISHPGINYLVKHVGSIFRRLFTLALDDIKQGERFSSTFKLIPNAVEKFLVAEFESMLWELMQEAAEKTHCSLEPMYSTIDPNLPTFHPAKTITEEEYVYVETDDGKYERQLKPVKKSLGMFDWAKQRWEALGSGSGAQAKPVLKNESKDRAMSKRSFLPDERTSMVTNEEIKTILHRSFEYIVALMDFNLICLKFHLNHYLYQGFKQELNRSFVLKLNNADWETLVQQDPAVKKRIEELIGQIQSIEDSLKDVETMYRRM